MAESEFRLKIISPTRIFFDQDVSMVEMKTTEGEIGVLPGHIPLTAVIEPGVIRIHQGDDIKEAAMLDGFLEIRRDRITILAESCEWPEEIDEARAREAKARAERRISGKDGSQIDMARAEIALKKAIVRLNMTSK